MGDVYVHVHALQGDDYEVTVRLPYKAQEEAASLLRRCADGVADSPLSQVCAQMLRCGGYQLSVDDVTRLQHTSLLGDHNPGDLFALVAPPVEVYVHGTSSCRTVHAGWEERSLRIPVHNGRTRLQEILHAFTGEPHDGLMTLSLDEEGEAVLSEGELDRGVASWVEEGLDYFVVALTAKKVPPTSSPRCLSIQHLPNDAQDSITIEELNALVAQARAEGAQRKAIALCHAVTPRFRATLGDAGALTVLLLLGELYVDAKKGLMAVATLRQALSSSSSTMSTACRCSIQRKIGMLLFDAKQFDEAAEVFRQYVVDNAAVVTTEELIEAKIRLGGSLFMGGKEIEGMSMVQTTLNGDLNNNLGVYWMTRFYTKRGLARDAITWAVQLVVRTHKDLTFGAQAKDLLAHVMRSFGADQCLKEINGMIHVPPEPNADLASVVGYLALVARDHSIMDLSVSLYRKALDICFTPLMALNFIHTLENDGRVFEALVEAKRCLEKLGPLSVGGVPAKAIAELLGSLDEPDRSFPVPPRVALERLKRPRSYVRVHPDESITLHETSESARKVPPSSLGPRPTNDTDGSTGSLYDSQPLQLEVLGIYFAVVKDAFILGLLDLLPELLRTINPLHKGCALHRTIMRNEAAYFASIALLMQHLDPDVTSDYSEDMEALYVVGDSHTLSPSWHVLQYDGRNVLLTCGVVTGLKIWHLRDGSDFYPKHLYHRVTASIPQKSHVMLILGEIDCREGIFQTVERGIYSSIADACNVLGKIYTSVAQQLVKSNDLTRLLIHSPPPSLDVTRRLVLQLTAELQLHFSRLSEQKVSYVIVPVLSPNGAQLQPQYALDQTHLSPLYVFDGLLRRSIEAALE